jgi:hypothetical protein
MFLLSRGRDYGAVSAQTTQTVTVHAATTLPSSAAVTVHPVPPAVGMLSLR